MKKISIAVLLSAFVAAPAMADNTGKFYVAGDYGSVSFTNSEVAPGARPFPNAGAVRISGGYHFSPMLAVEAGYLIIGDSTVQYRTFSDTTKNSALQIAAVGTFPVTPAFDLIGKLGMSLNSNKLTSTDGFYNSSTSSTSLMFGIGAQYNVNKKLSIRAQYEDFGKFSTNDGPLTPVRSWDMGVSMVSVGVVYKL